MSNCIKMPSYNTDIITIKKNLVNCKKHQIYNLLEEIRKINSEISDIRNELNNICKHKWIKEVDNIDFSTKYICEFCDC